MAAAIELGIQGLTYYKLRKGCLSLYTQTHLVTDAILEVGTVIRLLQASVFCNQMIIKALGHISLVLHNVYTISDTGKVHHHFWCQTSTPSLFICWLYFVLTYLWTFVTRHWFYYLVIARVVDIVILWFILLLYIISTVVVTAWFVYTLRKLLASTCASPD